MSLNPLPLPPLPFPQESAPLMHIFSMNGPLPAELKFRENTVFAGCFYLF